MVTNNNNQLLILGALNIKIIIYQDDIHMAN